MANIAKIKFKFIKIVIKKPFDFYLIGRNNKEYHLSDWYKNLEVKLIKVVLPFRKRNTVIITDNFKPHIIDKVKLRLKQLSEVFREYYKLNPQNKDYHKFLCFIFSEKKFLTFLFHFNLLIEKTIESRGCQIDEKTLIYDYIDYCVKNYVPYYKAFKSQQ